MLWCPRREIAIIVDQMKIEDNLTALGRLLAMWAAGSFLSFFLVVLCVGLLSYVFGIGDEQIPGSMWEASGALVGGLLIAAEEQRIWELEERLKRSQGPRGSSG
jgi:hypothetical protein